MALTKPTALAAFAAKAKRVELEELCRNEAGGSPGRALAQLKVPSLQSLQSLGEVTNAPTKPSSDVGLASPVMPLKVLNEPRTSGSSSRKLVAGPSSLAPVSPSKLIEAANELEQQQGRSPAAPSPRTAKARRGSRRKPLESTEKETEGKIDGVQSASSGGDLAGNELQKSARQHVAQAVDETSTQDDAIQHESIAATESKPQAAANASDGEDFTFDDVDDEKEGAKPSDQPVEKDDSAPPPLTEAKSATVDVEDLYDCPPDPDSEITRFRQQRQPRMFLPRASNIELFHVVLTEDTDQLAQFLEETSPQEVLEIVDSAGRNLYHYAALSKDKLVQGTIFHHVNVYRDLRFGNEVQALMRKKEQMNAWMDEKQSNGKGWVPPRVKELQRETTKHKCADWTAICNSVDENGRTLLHYIATTSSAIPIEDDYEFCSVLRAQSSILSTKDNFKKLALHYAVEAGNLKQVKWHFQMGAKLSQADVDLLLSFNVSRLMANAILRQLEAIDIQNYHLPAPQRDPDECDPGISTFVLAKLQRGTDDSAGRLHQFPLHRAAMFGNIRAVELLLEDGADPAARDANHWTPLHYCADEVTANHLCIAELLLNTTHTVDINARSLKGRSPLHVAVRSRKRTPLRHCADPQAVEASDCEDRLAFVTCLHQHDADLDLKDASGATSLLLACRGGGVPVVKFLLSAECEPTATGDNKWNALHYAAIRGDPGVVAFLLSWDADSRLWIDSPDTQGRKPADVAKTDRVRQLLANLWMGCYNGNVDQVRGLLLARSKRKPKARGHDGLVSVSGKTAQTERSALHLAILGYLDTLQSPQASASSREERRTQAKADEQRRTAPGRFLQVVVLLLQAGADLCAADKWGITPLMLAASIKDATLVETLLDRISDEDDLSQGDADGSTALHYSYAFCQAQASTLLEDQMEDPDVENQQGKSPFEMTGHRDKVYPREYRAFLQRQHELRKRQQCGSLK